VRQLRASVHRDHEDADALYEAASIDLVDGDVPDCQLQQRHLVCCSGQTHRDDPEDCMEAGPCYSGHDGCGPDKYLGGRPRFKEGVKHKGGGGTAKQCIAVAVEREGSVKAALVKHNGETALRPFVEGAVDPAAYLMSDHNQAYVMIAESFAGHSYVDHGDREYARGEVHNNTAESYNALLERAKVGVFHQISKEHMQRYVDEVAFRWNQRVPVGTRFHKGKEKVVMKHLPIIEKIQKLLQAALNVQIRWTRNSSIYAIA